MTPFVVLFIILFIIGFLVALNYLTSPRHERTTPLRQLAEIDWDAIQDEAVQAAKLAFKSWSAQTMKERVQYIFKYRNLLLRDRETLIVFQCHHGIRSQHAAEYFRHEGFRNLCNLQGGIDAWSLLIDPTVPRY